MSEKNIIPQISEEELNEKLIAYFQSSLKGDELAEALEIVGLGQETIKVLFIDSDGLYSPIPTFKAKKYDEALSLAQKEYPEIANIKPRKIGTNHWFIQKIKPEQKKTEIFEFYQAATQQEKDVIKELMRQELAV